MNQTNLFSCRLSMRRPRFAKPLGFSVVCLALMFILGTQKSTAQTATELGEVKSSEVVALIQGEVDFLEMEQKVPVGPVKTDKNDQIARYYSEILSSFRKGGDIKEAFMYVESTYGAHKGSPAGFATHPAQSVMDPATGDLKDLQLLVNQLNLSDNSDSDLVAIFNYWRTLKNQ